MYDQLPAPKNNVANLKEYHNVHAVERIDITHANGSSEFFETSMDYNSNALTKGDGYFKHSRKNVQCSPNDHLSEFKSELTIKSTYGIDDGQGNKITHGKAIKFEDGSSTEGTKLISDQKKVAYDPRPQLIDAFNSGSFGSFSEASKLLGQK